MGKALHILKSTELVCTYSGIKSCDANFSTDAKNLLKSNTGSQPVLYLEHRWLHNTEDPDQQILITNNIGDQGFANWLENYYSQPGLLTLESMKALPKDTHNIDARLSILLH